MYWVIRVYAGCEDGYVESSWEFSGLASRSLLSRAMPNSRKTVLFSIGREGSVLKKDIAEKNIVTSSS